jgi:hypothetical protein
LLLLNTEWVIVTQDGILFGGGVGNPATKKTAYRDTEGKKRIRNISFAYLCSLCGFALKKNYSIRSFFDCRDTETQREKREF